MVDQKTKLNLVSTCNWSSSADICNYHNGQPKQWKFHRRNKSTCRFKITNNYVFTVLTFFASQCKSQIDEIQYLWLETLHYQE